MSALGEPARASRCGTFQAERRSTTAPAGLARPPPGSRRASSTWSPASDFAQSVSGAVPAAAVAFEIQSQCSVESGAWYDLAAEVRQIFGLAVLARTTRSARRRGPCSRTAIRGLDFRGCWRGAQANSKPWKTPRCTCSSHCPPSAVGVPPRHPTAPANRFDLHERLNGDSTCTSGPGGGRGRGSGPGRYGLSRVVPPSGGGGRAGTRRPRAGPGEPAEEVEAGHAGSHWRPPGCGSPCRGSGSCPTSEARTPTLARYSGSGGCGG